MEKLQYENKKSTRLLKSLASEYKNIGYNTFVSALRKKDIIVNQKRVSENILLGEGDIVCAYIPSNSKKEFFAIFYEDDNILVINKKKGIEVCDGEFNVQSLLLESGRKAKAVHRIDLNTSGLVLFSKNATAHKILCENLKSGNIHKYYVAKVFGEPKQSENLVGYLQKDKDKSLVKISDTKIGEGEKIETPYRLLKNEGEVSLVEVKLVGGKTHQIRAHLAYAGLPIVGDGKYGKNEINRKYAKSKQLLTAYKLEFSFEKTCELCYLNDKTFVLEDFDM